MDRTALLKAFNECFAAVDLIVGLYHDASEGFRKNRDHLLKSQKASAAQGIGTPPTPITIEQLDAAHMIYGEGDPRQPNAKVLHYTTQRAYKERNDRGGLNDLLMADLCVVMIYQYWDDQYRGAIARAADLEKADVQSPVMGELRHLRRSIVHNARVAVPEVARNTILPRFEPGALIEIKRELFNDIVAKVQEGLLLLAQRLIGPDIQMRSGLKL